MSINVDPLDALEDVIAFIDSFSDPPGVDVGGHHNELAFSGFSSDINSDADAQSEKSDALLHLLESVIPTIPTIDSSTAAPLSRAYCNIRPVPPTSSRDALAAAAAVIAPKPIKDATRKRNAHREKTKRELQHLRERAVEMEQQLMTLRQGAIALSPKDKQLVDSSWKHIAENQLAALKVSEAENERLKDLLRGHMAMVRSMEQKCGQRFDNAFMEHASTPQMETVRAASTGSDECFAALARDLEATFARLDLVMQESGLTATATESTRSCRLKISVSPSGVVTPYTELADIEVTPFQSQQTAKAVWGVVRHLYRQKRVNKRAAEVRQTGNTFAVHCQYSFKNLDEQEMLLNCRFVLRKYVDDESRVVLVWRAHYECEQDLSGVYADETGWCVVQPIPPSCGLSTHGSVMRTCIHVVQRVRAAASVAGPPHDPSGCVLADLVMASNDEDMIGISKAIENLLLTKGTSSA